VPKILPSQVKCIHTLLSRYGIEDGDYRAILNGYGVASSLALTVAEAADLIVKLQNMSSKKLTREATAAAVPVPGGIKKKFDELGQRPGMASPAQLRFVEGLWAEISRQPDAATRANALRTFLKRIVGIEEITWLEPGHVKKIIRALLVMKQNSRKAYHEQQA
jgi:Protein of unknown function (DUF1018)